MGYVGNNYNFTSGLSDIKSTSTNVNDKKKEPIHVESSASGWLIPQGSSYTTCERFSGASSSRNHRHSPYPQTTLVSERQLTPPPSLGFGGWENGSPPSLSYSWEGHHYPSYSPPHQVSWHLTEPSDGATYIPLHILSSSQEQNNSLS